MLNKLVMVTSWAALGFVVFATISPIQSRPTLPASSSFEHLAAFALLGMLFRFAYPKQIMLVCVIILGSAVLLEFAQLLTPDRHGRVQDAVEKMIGGALGIAVAQAILGLEQIRRWFDS